MNPSSKKSQKKWTFSRWLLMKSRKLFIPFIRFLKYYSYQTPYIEGDGGSLHLGKRVGLSNTLINTESGSVYIGDYTIFGYNVMVLTGRHSFRNGKRGIFSIDGTNGGPDQEVPRSGFDIKIGKGCWIASGAIITGGVTIGDNVIIAAGAVITKDIPDFSIAAGIPAKVVGDTRERAKN